MGKDSIDAGSIVSVQSYGSVDAPHPNERRPKYGPVEREMREFNLDTAKRRWRERAGGSTAVRSLDEVRILAANQKRLNSSGRRVFDRIKAIWKKGPAARPEHLRAVYKRSPADQIAGRDLPQNAKNALTAKYMGAHRAATVSNASQFALGIATDRRASFKNLELFARHGQRLHSGDKASKLKATLSNIPKRVLDRASSQVDSDDYAKADVLRDDGSQRRLLSFGRFKFPSAAGGAFGAQAKAHRANLRALTASAFLLGGADAAQEVKAKLAVLNERGNNDAIMKNLLARLERHGSVEALMKDINTCLLESEAIKVRGDLGARGIEEGPGVAHIGREAFKAWSEINYGVGSPQSLDLVNRLDAVANSWDGTSNEMQGSQVDRTHEWMWQRFACDKTMSNADDPMRTDVKPNDPKSEFQRACDVIDGSRNMRPQNTLLVGDNNLVKIETDLMRAQNKTDKWSRQIGRDDYADQNPDMRLNFSANPGDYDVISDDDTFVDGIHSDNDSQT